MRNKYYFGLIFIVVTKNKESYFLLVPFVPFPCHHFGRRKSERIKKGKGYCEVTPQRSNGSVHDTLYVIVTSVILPKLHTAPFPLLPLSSLSPMRFSFSFRFVLFLAPCFARDSSSQRYRFARSNRRFLDSSA